MLVKKKPNGESFEISELAWAVLHKLVAEDRGIPDYKLAAHFDVELEDIRAAIHELHELGFSETVPVN